MAYLSKTDIAAFLKITLSAADEAVVEAIIPAVSAFVDKYCDRTWTKETNTDIVETFDGGVDSFFVHNSPIASIQSVVDNGFTVSQSSIFNYETFVKLSYTPAKIPRSIVITYRTSANALPADIKHALVRWVSEIFKSSPDAGKTVTKVSSGPVSVDFLTQDGIPKFVQMVLDQYKLIAL